MSRKKYVAMSFLILMALSNFVDAALIHGEYIVSFIAGRTAVGLVRITQTDTGIQAAQHSIIPLGRNLGSTAILLQYGAWDYGFSYDVLVISGSIPANPLEVGLIKFDSELNKTSTLSRISQIPGQVQPLLIFQTGFTRGGGARTGSLLTAGSGSFGENNYVSYLLQGQGRTKIFVNPYDRSPGSAAVSPDGKLASEMTFKGLNHIGLIGRLVNKKLARTPFEWLNVNQFQGYSQSLTNPIESMNSATRFLGYRNFRQRGSSNSESQVTIQNVDSKTGKAQGPPHAITTFAKAMNVETEKLQSIALSSNGELVLYTAWNNDCNKQILYARKLINGFGSGDSYIVVGCEQLEKYPIGIYGINITAANP
jgi:hypothetical protein